MLASSLKISFFFIIKFYRLIIKKQIKGKAKYPKLVRMGMIFFLLFFFKTDNVTTNSILKLQ